MANSIKIGGFSFDALKIGSSDVDAVYLGDTLVYTGGTTPPTPSFKWKAIYQDSHVESAQCDSSSAITQNEINPLNLVSVEIGNCVTSIGTSAFRGCRNLTSIDIPSGVTSIGGSAFNSCSGLTSCTIGSGVTSIGIYAFNSCSSLTNITVNATTPPTLGSRAFNGSTCPIYVQVASLTAYQTAWSDYASRIQAIPNS